MLLAFGALLLHTSCQHEHEKKEMETTFSVTTPVKKDTTIIHEYVSQVRSIRNIELRALEKGYLQDILVDEGQFVKEGQLMFRIKANLYQAELQKAEAEVKAAEIEVQNAKALADKNVVSKNELALAEAKLEKAKAERELARVHLSFTEIRAPFSGITNRLEVRDGSLVDEGELLTTLSDNSKMWVYFNVPEAEYLNYKTNTPNGKKLPVRLLMANNEMFDHVGIVETIEGEFDNETGNIAFRATFPNPEGLLRHGETGNILAEVPIKNGVIIPQKATFEVLDKKYVYVVDKEDTVKSREVKIGAEFPDLYVVTEGLEANEKILLEGIRKVRDDDKISYDFEEPHKVFASLSLPAE
jgi:membrane fusion protein (multidrug efflux system)